MKNFLFIVGLSLLVVGCSSKSTVMDTGTDTHEILLVGDTGFTSLSDMQIKAVNDAHKYCAKKGKQYVFVSKRVQPTAFAVFPEVDLFFKCK